MSGTTGNIKILICGSRNWRDVTTIKKVIDKLPQDATVVEGEARGADTIARVLAQARGLKVEPFPIIKREWDKYGLAAGPIRNRRMLESGVSAVIAFRMMGKSSGTDDMINQARKQGIPVRVIYEGEKIE